MLERSGQMLGFSASYLLKETKFLEELDPRRKIDFVRDPIYQYIPFTKSTNDKEVTEENLINSKWVQRLRRIFQTQTTWIAYPGAVHSRFQHSLGVMHLAGEFVRTLYPSYRKFICAHDKDKYSNSEGLSRNFPKTDYVVEVFRIAGLLHDIGHGPMSHAFDNYYLNRYNLTHEDLSREIIHQTELWRLIAEIQRSPGGKLEKPVDPKDVVDVLYPYDKKQKIRADLEVWKKLLFKVIRGMYSADKLDYLLRDSYYCGTQEFGLIDVKRLLFTSMLTPKGLTLHKSSLYFSLTTVILARLYMFQSVYYHRYCRALELSVCNTIPEIMEIIRLGNPLDNLGKFWFFAEVYLYSLCSQWAEEEEIKKQEIGRKWREVLNGNLPWVEAYFQPLFIKEGWPKLLESFMESEVIKQKIKKGLEKRGLKIEFKVDVPKLDVRPENPLIDSEDIVEVYDSDKNEVQSYAIKEVLKNIPIRFLGFRIFSKPKDKLIIREICETLFEKKSNKKKKIEM